MLARTDRSSRRAPRPRTWRPNVLLVDRRCVYYKREQTGRFRRFRVARLWRSRCSGTSVGRMLEVALSGPSPSVVVDDVATFVRARPRIRRRRPRSRSAQVPPQSVSQCADYPFEPSGSNRRRNRRVLNRNRRRCRRYRSRHSSIRCPRPGHVYRWPRTG